MVTAAPTFCKCTCFSNSTIIEITNKPKTSPVKNPPPAADPDQKDPVSQGDESPISERRAEGHLSKRAGPASCSQCNRAFCLDYNLPICKGAEEKDVVTMCFQRDSRKDQIIVWGFIVGTLGLLGWAGAQKVIAMREKGRAMGIGLGGSGGADGAARSPGLSWSGSAGRGPTSARGNDSSRGAYQAVEDDIADGGSRSSAG